jgi:hypothetical protein
MQLSRAPVICAGFLPHLVYTGCVYGGNAGWYSMVTGLRSMNITEFEIGLLHHEAGSMPHRYFGLCASRHVTTSEITWIPVTE